MGLPAVRTSACGRLDVGGCEFVIRYAPLSEKAVMRPRLQQQQIKTGMEHQQR